MKKLHPYYIITVALISFLSACGQKDKQKAEVENAVDKIDSLKGTFDPSAAIKPSSSHWALNVQFNGQAFVVDSNYVFIRKGKLPYANEPKPSLPFVVKYMDSAGKLLGQYSIETPTSLKSCEPGTEGIKPGIIQSFEILVPALENIRTIAVDSAGKQWKQFALPRRKLDDRIIKPGSDSIQPR